MDSDSLLNEWSSDDASESQPHDVPDLDNDSQRATAGRRSQLRPAGLGLAFVPLADWKPELLYDEQPPENIRYEVEWKLSVNNRQRSGESESGIQDLTSMDRARGRCITRTNYNIAPARLPTRCWVKIDI